MIGDCYQIAVSFPGGTYDVVVGEGALELGLERFQQRLRERSVFVLSSPTVRRLHGEKLGRLLRGSRVIELEVPDGERAKSLRYAEKLWRRMLLEGGKRDSLMVALGGGAIGDLGGFVAATFLRGIEWVQVPTTLLAQVDASVGGKTAIDLPEAKNSVGAFHQPALVLADTCVLETLPKEELRAGLIEVIKMAFVLDPGLLDQVESNLERLLNGELAPLAEVVARAIRAKVSVVEKDPFESGDRRLLNFGHTLGHAIESSLGYREIRHGEAVGYGMLFALRLARQRGLNAADAGRLSALVRAIGLPTLPALEVDELMTLMARDKKAKEQAVVWVLPTALGRGEAVADLPPSVARDALGEFLQSPLQ